MRDLGSLFSLLLAGCLLLAAIITFSPTLHAQPFLAATASSPLPRNTTNSIVLPPSVPDPLEPLNRIVWSVNKAVMIGVIRPTSRVYRFVIPKPARTAIGHFGKNLTYPGRLINNLLQAKWTGARDESYRFACNTTVGVLGLFDVADRWHIPKSEADFGQTFGQWGWDPACFLMLPLLGPSNERDLLGLAADTAANPLLYISPYDFDAHNPFTYLGPYSYFTYVVAYNDLSDSVNEYVRFSRAEPDPYSEIQYAWTFVRKNRVADFKVTGKPDAVSKETIESVFFKFNDLDFPTQGRTRSVRIPSTQRDLKFTYWLQPGNAPVVYIIPGMGSHRLTRPCLALAEFVFNHGYSAVCLSSAYNPEFMEHASTANLPAYLPVDGDDVHVALTEIDRLLRKRYPSRLGSNALLGYSMGAYHALFIAATSSTNQQSRVPFDRYVALSTPVHLQEGVNQLDNYYRAPLEWPETDRSDKIQNTFLKAATLDKNALTPDSSLPFDSVESRFLIGLTFRYMLRDVIYSSQQRNNQGVLKHSLKSIRRDPIYQEILQYSFQDYFDRFAVPYYQTRGLASPVAESLERANALPTYEAGLRANTNIQVIVNENDFLLSPPDLQWLRSTIPPERLKVFEQGGHMGNLSNSNVQHSILRALSGLGAKSNPAPRSLPKPTS